MNQSTKPICGAKWILPSLLARQRYVSRASGVIGFSKYAESRLMVSPGSPPLGLKELGRFYERVAGSESIALMIQDADFTGSGIPPRVYVSLSRRLENLAFAKLENPLRGPKCAEIMRESEGRLQVIFGLWGIYIADGLPRGAAGTMAGPGITEIYARIISLFEEGRIGDSRQLLYHCLPY
jgi:hypothetical protein